MYSAGETGSQMKSFSESIKRTFLTKFQKSSVEQDGHSTIQLGEDANSFDIWKDKGVKDR